MTRFRKWLIHKLGGMTKDDIPPINMHIEKHNVQTLRVSYVVSSEFDYPFVDENRDNIAYNVLLDKLRNGLKDYVTFDCSIDRYNTLRYTMELKVVERNSN